MTIPLFTNVPNSNDPVNFAAYMDALLAGLNPWATAANALAAAMTAVAAGGAVSLQFTFDTATADADPTAGKLRLNQATQNTSTIIRTDLVGSDGSTYTDVLALFDDSTSTNKGYLKLLKADDATKWLLFAVASVATPGGYKNITATCVAYSTANPFANGDALLLDFTPTGDAGTPGATGAAGPSAVLVAKGNSGTSTQTYDYSAGGIQTSTATGNHTLATSNWPTTGNLGILLIRLTNGGAYTLTMPTINWIKPDGTTTTSFSTYMASLPGRSALQSSGTDQILWWSSDAGSTIYGKLV